MVIAQMNSSLDWDDYRIILQITDAGSLAKAASLAGLSHPTMFRRINAIEERLGVRLFDRFRTGYRPTLAGEALVATAREIAELATTAERRLAGQDLRPAGKVRIATTDTLFHGLLAPEISRLRKLEPDITLEVVVSNEVSDLSRREADIALRPVLSPEQHLVGRKLGVIRQAVYGHKELLAENKAKNRLEAMPWIGPARSMNYNQLQVWMGKNGFDAACVCRIDTVLGMYRAVQQGTGVAVLPAYLAGQDPDLSRHGKFVDEMAADLWLLTHPDLRQTARIRAVLDHLGKSRHIKAPL
jgi:DNA-binding transcriptional LysR family regulator